MHEIIHSHTRHVTVGDPVVVGQLIGTMGNTGVSKKEPKKGPQHVHYQLKDSAGNLMDPSAHWDQQGRVDLNLTPPAFLNEHQRYLRRVDESAGNTAAAPLGVAASTPFGTGGQFAPGSAASSRPLYETRSFIPQSAEAMPADTRKDIRRLVRMPARKQDLAGFNPNAPATVPNEVHPAGGPASFGDRFGNWVSSSGVSAPLAPNQQMAPPPQAGRPLGLVTGQPMPDYLFPLPIPSNTGNEDWAWNLLRRADWDKAR